MDGITGDSLQLRDYGYILFKNVLTDADVAKGLACIDGKRMNYSDMDRFVTDTLLPIPKKYLNWFSDSTESTETKDSVESIETETIKKDNIAPYTKYRYSNNNNNDAVAFHRDIFPNVRISEHTPIYTVLTYFDTSTMELIPGTHRNTALTDIEAIKKLSSATSLTIEPRDVLVFHSLLLHRGVFDRRQKNRRLLQVFECYPNIATHDLYNNRILHVPGTAKNLSIMDSIKKMPIIDSIVNLLGYINAATGYGVRRGYISIDKDNTIFYSSEGFSRRYIKKENDIDDINLYYIKDNIIDTRMKTEDFVQSYYTRNFIIIVLKMILVLYLLILLMMYIYKRM